MLALCDSRELQEWTGFYEYEAAVDEWRRTHPDGGDPPDSWFGPVDSGDDDED